MILKQLLAERQTLYECRLVSKQFHVIANPLLGKVLNFDNLNAPRFFVSLSTTSPQRITTIGQHVHELHLDNTLITNPRLAPLLSHLSSLTQLAFYFETKITNAGLQYLLAEYQLTALELLATPLKRPSFSILAQHCRQLVDLEWTLSYRQSPEWLEMFRDCPLEHLRITLNHTALTEKTMITIQFFHL